MCDKGSNIIVHSEKHVQLLVNDVLSYTQLQITIIQSLIHISHVPASRLSLVVHCIDCVLFHLMDCVLVPLSHEVMTLGSFLSEMECISHAV